jgi:hypothetical protein
MTSRRLAAWVAETREDRRLARENRAEQEALAAALHQRAATAALLRHPELSTVDLAMGHGGVDHLEVLANAFTDADSEDRAQRRQRAEVLAERRQTAPMPVARSHAEVLNDYLTWSNWIDQADGAATAP